MLAYTNLPYVESFVDIYLLLKMRYGSDSLDELAAWCFAIDNYSLTRTNGLLKVILTDNTYAVVEKHSSKTEPSGDLYVTSISNVW